jgi:hypothetical protein
MDRKQKRSRLGCERGQTLVLLAGAAVILLLFVGVLGALGKALLGRGRLQRAADLAAVSAARSMRDDFPRLFDRGPHGLSKVTYLERARAAAIAAARSNGAALDADDEIEFPDGRSFAPTRVRVSIRARVPVRVGTGVPAHASAEAEIDASGGVLPADADGGGYAGPLAYRQGKPMRPDVATAFDRLYAAARGDGVTLVITSAYRSDAEQAKLFAEHPDPHWVARPGHSLHRYGTELDLGPASAYGWLQRNAGRFHFNQRYEWEQWHYGYGLNPHSAPLKAGRERAIPSFVPAPYVQTIAHAAMRWNVSAAMIAAQLYAESNFNPLAVSRAGARGIAQFMPGTAGAYGLADPFDAAASISAQAHLMRDLLRKFGSVSLALAAYNAGSGAVERCGCVPPYPETQAYVARIIGLMGGAGALPIGANFEVRLVS